MPRGGIPSRRVTGAIVLIKLVTSRTVLMQLVNADCQALNGMLTIARMVTLILLPQAASNPMLMDCMTCWEMCWNGRKIVGTPTTTVPRLTGARGQQDNVPLGGCCEVVLGLTNLESYALHIDKDMSQRAVIRTTAFGLPETYRNNRGIP